jgi:serine/threonine-protein kinase
MSAPRPPAQIGSVRLLEPLGEGGMAIVFKGEDRFRPGAFSAVKLLRPEVHRDAELVRRFLREGDVLTRLSHPSLVEIFSFGTCGTWPYLVMELLPGGSLKACRGEAPAALARRLIPVCGALAVAHGAGVVHRDLKPSNVFLTKKKDGSTQVKVMDFGLARLLQVGPGQASAGSAGYLAPEQMLGMQATFASDLYSVGVILFELLAGRRPFVAKDNLELMQLTMMMPVPLLKEVLGPEAPEPLNKLLASLLAKNPKDRPLGASVVRAELLALAPSSAA